MKKYYYFIAFSFKDISGCGVSSTQFQYYKKINSIDDIRKIEKHLNDVEHREVCFLTFYKL